MRILVDTQAFIWFVEDDKQLPAKVKKELEDSDNSIIISIASLWEMTIKMTLGKLHLGCPIEEMIENIYQNGFEILTILPGHIELSKLDYFHRDPFDRIIMMCHGWALHAEGASRAHSSIRPSLSFSTGRSR